MEGQGEAGLDILFTEHITGKCQKVSQHFPGLTHVAQLQPKRWIAPAPISQMRSQRQRVKSDSKASQGKGWWLKVAGQRP